MNASISARGLGKAYKRYASPWNRLAEWLSPVDRARHEKTWVLRDLDFDIVPGETVGVVGVNGAGKSTLLKIIARTTTPTTGSVRVDGRIAAILELGLGFHPDLTGFQNVAIGGQLLGLADAEIRALLPKIEEFAEIGAYMGEPLRTYSTGMQVRLAFSVATALRPDVLIVDEALSVGDAYFQFKSFDRIRQFRAAGTTLLFVSHNESVIKSICDRALLLDGGLLLRDGTPDDVLDYYNATIARREADYEIRVASPGHGGGVRSGNRRAEVTAIDLVSAEGESLRAARVGEAVVVRVVVAARAALGLLTVGFIIRDVLGNAMFGTNSTHLGKQLRDVGDGDEFVVEFTLRNLDLGTGSYTISVAAHADVTHLSDNYDWWDNALAFQVVPGKRPHSIGVVSLECACAVSAGKDVPRPLLAAAATAPAEGVRPRGR